MLVETQLVPVATSAWLDQCMEQQTYRTRDLDQDLRYVPVLLQRHSIETYHCERVQEERH
jgi:hypothetical protein